MAPVPSCSPRALRSDPKPPPKKQGTIGITRLPASVQHLTIQFQIQNAEMNNLTKSKGNENLAEKKCILLHTPGDTV